MVSVPPEIKERFLGTSGVTWSSSPYHRENILASGPGEIIGSVISSGKPVAGLRVRLALNGSVMSQWAATDAAGKYAIAVPYGKYRIDGYELDYAMLDALLGGKTDAPQNNQIHGSDDIITVAKGKAGRAFNLGYVDPVRKKGPKGKVPLSKPVVLEWEAYPAATAYRIQLTEMKDPQDFNSQRQVFDWRDRPTVSGTSLNLTERGVKLKKGYVYTVGIEALDVNGRMLADAPDRHLTPDFVATD
jgi:hypothetical protein